MPLYDSHAKYCGDVGPYACEGRPVRPNILNTAKSDPVCSGGNGMRDSTPVGLLRLDSSAA